MRAVNTVNPSKGVKSMNFKRYVSTFVLLASIVTFLAACNTSNTGSSSTERDGQILKVRVAVANDFNPYAYLDEKGNNIGYEVDVLKKVDELLPEYEFEYQTVSDQFVALTANKIDLIASQWEKNPEREEAYLFGKHLVTTWAAFIAFKDGRTDIQSLEDLAGKTIQTSQGTNDAFLLESYNKKNNNAINIEYGASDITVFLKKIENGAIDAFISPLRSIELIEENYDVALGVSNKPVYNSNTYFIYRKNDAKEAKLQEAVDGALKTLSNQGTLKELSIQWLGEDYTKEAVID